MKRDKTLKEYTFECVDSNGAGRFIEVARDPIEATNRARKRDIESKLQIVFVQPLYRERSKQ